MLYIGGDLSRSPQGSLVTDVSADFLIWWSSESDFSSLSKYGKDKLYFSKS